MVDAETEVSILYWRCLPVSISDLAAWAQRSFNSLLEMHFWLEGGVAGEELVSILYWRCASLSVQRFQL